MNSRDFEEYLFDSISEKYYPVIWAYFSHSRYQPLVKKIVHRKLNVTEIRKQLIVSKDESIREYLVEEYVVANRWGEEWDNLRKTLLNDHNAVIRERVRESLEKQPKIVTREKNTSLVHVSEIIARELDTEKQKVARKIVDSISEISSEDEILLVNPGDRRTFYFGEIALYHDITTFWQAFKNKRLQEVPRSLPISSMPARGDDWDLAYENYICYEHPQIKKNFILLIVSRLSDLMRRQAQLLPEMIKDIAVVREDNMKFHCLVHALVRQDLEPCWRSFENLLNEHPETAAAIAHLLRETKLKNRFEELVRRDFPRKVFPYNEDEKLCLSSYITALYVLGSVDSLADVACKTEDQFVRREILDFILKDIQKEKRKPLPLLAEFARKLTDSDDEQDQWQALEILAYFGDASDYHYGLEFLESASLQITLAALDIIHAYGNLQDTAQTVLPYLDHPERVVVAKTFQILTTWGTGVLWPQIHKNSKETVSPEQKSFPADFVIEQSDNTREENLSHLIEQRTPSDQPIENRRIILHEYPLLDFAALQNAIECAAKLLSSKQPFWIRECDPATTTIAKIPCIHVEKQQYGDCPVLFPCKEWKNPLILLLSTSSPHEKHNPDIPALLDIIDFLSERRIAFLLLFKDDCQSLIDLLREKYGNSKDKPGWFFQIPAYPSENREKTIKMIEAMPAPVSLEIPKLEKSTMSLQVRQAERVCVEYVKQNWERGILHDTEICWIEGSPEKFDHESMEQYLVVELGISRDLPGKISLSCVKEAILAQAKQNSEVQKTGFFQDRPYRYFPSSPGISKNFETGDKEFLDFIFTHISADDTFQFAIQHCTDCDTLYHYSPSVKEFFNGFEHFGRLPEHVLFLVPIAEYESSGVAFNSGMEEIVEHDGLDDVIPLIDKLAQQHSPYIIIDVLLKFSEEGERDGLYKIIRHLGGVREENIPVLQQLFSRNPENETFLRYLASIHSPQARRAIVENWRDHNVPWLKI